MKTKAATIIQTGAENFLIEIETLDTEVSKVPKTETYGAEIIYNFSSEFGAIVRELYYKDVTEIKVKLFKKSELDSFKKNLSSEGANL